jgi:hypothetical protein
MKNPKLIELLKSLNQEELNQFELFIRSPLLGCKPQVIKLLDILKKYYPVFSSTEYSKQNVFLQLCPGKQFNASLLNGYYCLLSNMIIKFFQYVSNERNEVRSQIDLLNEYRLRGLNFDFIHLAKNIEKKLLSEKFDASVFNSIFAYQIVLLNFKTENFHSGKLEEINKLYEDYSKFLVYLSNIFICEYLNAKICFFNDFDSFNFEKNNLYRKLDNKKILLTLLNTISEHNPFDFVHKINLAYLSLIENDNCDSYMSYKNIIFQYADKLKNDELELHLNLLKTYCIDKCTQLNIREKYSQEYIDIEFYILNEKLFQNQKTKFLQNRSYRNILIFLVNKKEINKIKELQEFTKFLPIPYRSSYKNFTLAYIFYCSGNQSETLKHLSRVGSADKQLALDCSLLKLKIFFDQRNYVKGFDKIHSTRRIINKNSAINKERKQKYRVFLNYLERLFKRIEKEDEAGMHILFKEILNRDNILYSEWFSEKYLELFGQSLKKSI